LAQQQNGPVGSVKLEKLKISPSYKFRA